MAVAREVESADGVRIAVFEEGNPDGPPLVMTHDWPDSHALWDGVVPLLADRYRIIRYDNRGVGGSTVPKPVRAYTMECLANDFEAVIDALSPDQPVHVLGHDWGSILVWEYLSRPQAGSRIASFTSVAGPSTDHYSAFIRDGIAQPHRPLTFLRALGLGARMWYWIPLSIPVLAPAAMRRGLGRRVQAIDSPGAPTYRGPSFEDDGANTLKIYRAILTRPPLKPRRDHYVTVPVQAICNDRDPVVRAYGYTDEARWVQRLWRRDFKAGHWSPFSHAPELAQAVNELVDHLDGAPAAADLERAQVVAS